MNFWTDGWGRVVTLFSVPWGVPPGGRLTLTSGTPVTTSDVTNAATLYYTPYIANTIGLWNGISWQNLTFLETSLACSSFATQAMATTGNTTSGTQTITGIPSTTGLSVGNLVDSANFPNGSTIITVNSSTQVTVNNNATATSTGVAVRFYYAIYDIFGKLDPANGLVLSGLAWTNLTARATTLALTDGHLTLTTDKTKLYLGTVMLTLAQQSGTTAATDSAGLRGVWNYYNRKARALLWSTGGAWTYGPAGWRQAGGNPAAVVAWVSGVMEEPVWLQVSGQQNNSVGVAGNYGIGIDSTTTNSSDSANENAVGGGGGTINVCVANYNRFVPIGYHYGAWIEYGRAGTFQAVTGTMRGTIQG